MITVSDLSGADLALEVDRLNREFGIGMDETILLEVAKRLREQMWTCSGCGFTTDDGDQLAKHLYKQHLPGNRNER